MADLYLIVDAGTSLLKIALIRVDGTIERVDSSPIPISINPEDEFQYDLDVNAMWEKILETLGKWKDDIDLSVVRGISASAMRIATVFCDAAGEVLYAGPNIDLRGIETQDEIEDELDGQDFEITGRNPPLLFSLARLLWFKENEEEIYKRIASVYTLNAWLLFKFSGVSHSEITAAADTMLLNVQTNQWDATILETFELDPDLLPSLRYPGEILGSVDPALVNLFGFSPDALAVCGAGDSQAALIGMGVSQKDQLGIIVGSTGPMMWVHNAPMLDPEKKFWLDPYREGMWVTEANLKITGRIFKWFVEDFFKDVLGVDYTNLDEKILTSLSGESEVFAFLGPDLMNFADMTGLSPGVIIFPSPGGPTPSTLSYVPFARAILENIVFAIKLNLEELVKFTGRDPQEVFLTGGLGQSLAFRKLLAAALDMPVKSPSNHESSLVGCFLLARSAIDPAFSIEDFSAEEGRYEITEVNQQIATHLTLAYQRWKSYRESVWKRA